MENPLKSQLGRGDDSFVANHLFGSFTGRETPVDLVVAVDGVAAGMGTSFYKDHWRFSLMVDPELVKPTPGSVEIYEVISEGLFSIPVRWP